MTTYDLFPMNSRMVQRNLKPLFSKKRACYFICLSHAFFSVCRRLGSANMSIKTCLAQELEMHIISPRPFSIESGGAKFSCSLKMRLRYYAFKRAMPEWPSSLTFPASTFMCHGGTRRSGHGSTA